jgi:hypothetical protein
VSQEAFQTAVARLVTETDFRERVRADREAALDSDLSGLERRRLVKIAGDHGIGVTASLIASYRLGKVIGLLPLTRVLLGNERLAHELRSFWAEHPPTSFYAVEEGLAFCDHLRRALRLGRLRQVYLGEVVAYERAILELTRPRASGDHPPPQRVRFTHDPVRLLSPLGVGRCPRGVPERHCVFTGSLAEDGTMEWSVA